tara:strand:+ start:389 stop:580 length:192 start_codon:yes stop_codon:yes gene_type:complete
MTIRADQAETSIEFAIDNALDRMMILEGKDHHALLNEYKEWLIPSEKQIDILVLNYEGKSKST